MGTPIVDMLVVCVQQEKQRQVALYALGAMMPAFALPATKYKVRYHRIRHDASPVHLTQLHKVIVGLDTIGCL